MSVTSPAHETDPRQSAIPDTHGHAKGEHKPYAEERPIPYSARMLFLWFYHACRRGYPRFLMVADHMNSLTFEDPAAVHAVRRAIKHAEAGDLYGAAEIANVEVGHAAVVHEGITRRGMRYSIGAEVDNDPRSRPDAQNIVDAMKPDAMIRSIHFLTIPHPQTGAEYQWPFDNPEFVSVYDAVGTERVWELYMEQLLDAIEKLPGNIIGHFYVPAKFGHWPEDSVLETYEDRFVEACATHGKAIELNTRFFYRYVTDDASREKYRGANLRLLRKAKAANVGIAVGADAHSPKDQGRGFDEALSLLDEAEVNELVFPISGRLRTVALRATKELLDEVAAANLAALPEPPLAIDVPRSASTETPATPASGSRDEATDDGTSPRSKRATPKRPAGASSKRTTPGPAKGDSARGEARPSESAPAGADVPPVDPVEAASDVARAEHEKHAHPTSDAVAPDHGKFEPEAARGATHDDPETETAGPIAPPRVKAKRPAKPAAADEVPALVSEILSAEDTTPAVLEEHAAAVAAVAEPAVAEHVGEEPVAHAEHAHAPSEHVPEAATPEPADHKKPAAKAAASKVAPVKSTPAPAPVKAAAKPGSSKPAPPKAASVKAAPAKAPASKSPAKAAAVKGGHVKSAAKPAPPKVTASKSAAKPAAKAAPAKPAAKIAAAKPAAKAPPSKTVAKPAMKTAPVKAAPVKAKSATKSVTKATSAKTPAKHATATAAKKTPKKSPMQSSKKPAAKAPAVKSGSVVNKKPAATKKTATKTRR